MIHKYKYNGTNIVLDVNSGSIHVVSDLAFDALDFSVVQTHTHQNIDTVLNELEIIHRLKSRYDESDISECLSELRALIKSDRLFSPSVCIDTNREPILKALCLHVAHDCNLKCRYCFAGEGQYLGERGLMSAETGMKAIDFITDMSRARKNLEIDFFGGEPTMNFNAVKKIVEYAKTKKSKNFRFTLTTNAFKISDDIIDFCNDNMYNVVLSIDGRKEINDAMRPDKNGKGSYEKIVRNINTFLERRGHERYYVRGTCTKNNIDFSKDVTHLADLGFRQISIEPVVSDTDAPYGFTEQDVPALCSEYDKLVKIMVERDDFAFFHFNLDLTGGSCVYKRVSGCGAGCEYMSVTPDGSLYPCHQFTGLKDFVIGSVYTGVLNKKIPEQFGDLNIFSKKECDLCWAKFYCSGGCAANSYLYGGSIASNYEIGCKLHRKRIECAIYLQLVKNGFLTIDG